ncbi:hypothetical protein ACH0CP_18565 [Sphingomonas sp. 179-I 2A4 NHS]|jgi:hypothetical protein|uniref:hypothetical protein n=1 Tax=unclassified Sphingomonas TaxID=196159 RepID=UPI00387A1FE5
MTKDNLAYYERRAREEAEAEASAKSAEAASAHRLLAIEYEAQARELRLRSGPGTEDRGERAEESVSGEAKAHHRPKLSIR